MFRIARFGIGIARKARIPLESGIGRLLMPNLCRMYRRLVNPSKSITFNANNINCEIEHDEANDYEYEIPKGVMTEILAHIANIILSQENEIDWDKVIADSKAALVSQRLEKEVIMGHIVRACEMEKLYSHLVSYFEYLIKNKELCAGMLYLFCEAVAKNPVQLSKCLDMIFDIWKKLLPEQDIARNLCLSVLLRSSKYRTKLTDENPNVFMYNIGKEGLGYYFNNDGADFAFKFLSVATSENILSNAHHFINYFQTCAGVGEIPISRFVTFFDTLAKGNICLSNESIECITDFVSKVNKLDKDYMWYCKESEIGEYCKLCSGKLNKVDISQEEIDVLKVEIEKNVIYGQNINIKSTREEWKSFLKYINKKPYDIVLDGLNIWCACQKDPQFFSFLLKIIEKKELIPLTIARHHFITSSAYNMIHRKYPFFLAADLSHDDVFVMYAALNKGKNCYIVTNDQMGFAKTSVGASDLEELYVRWQASHQCYINKRGIIFPHNMALGVQKSPSTDEEEFRYHLIVKDASYRKLYCISRLRRQ